MSVSVCAVSWVHVAVQHLVCCEHWKSNPSVFLLHPSMRHITMHSPLPNSQQSWAAHALALQPYATQFVQQLQLPWGAPPTAPPTVTASSYDAPFNTAVQALFSSAVQFSAALPTSMQPVGSDAAAGGSQGGPPSLLQLPPFASALGAGILHPPPPLSPLKGPHVPEALDLVMAAVDKQQGVCTLCTLCCVWGAVLCMCVVMWAADMWAADMWAAVCERTPHTHPAPLVKSQHHHPPHTHTTPSCLHTHTHPSPPLALSNQMAPQPHPPTVRALPTSCTLPQPNTPTAVVAAAAVGFSPTATPRQLQTVVTQTPTHRWCPAASALWRLGATGTGPPLPSALQGAPQRASFLVGVGWVFGGFFRCVSRWCRYHVLEHPRKRTGPFHVVLS